MTYIDYLNGFNRWLEHNYLPLSSQILYFRMLDLFNRTGWADTVSVDNLRMMCMIQSDSRHTLLRARDALIDSGFLEYQKGKKGMPGKYKLGKGCKKCTVSGTENGTVSGTVSGTENGTHIKTKTKTKEKPPKGGKEKGTKIPPTVDEVREYCAKRKNGIDPEAFVAFYASKGWMVGKNKMKNWRSAVITWEKSRKKEGSSLDYWTK